MVNLFENKKYWNYLINHHKQKTPDVRGAGLEREYRENIVMWVFDSSIIEILSWLSFA
jgi:hypothetical protein